jgi:hypothetical protein
MKYLKKFESFSSSEESIGINFQSEFTPEMQEQIENEIYNHAADMIEQGFTSGELVGEEPEYKGWWKISIEEDENDEEDRNKEVASKLRDGNTNGYYPTYSFSANVWVN